MKITNSRRNIKLALLGMAGIGAELLLIAIFIATAFIVLSFWWYILK